MYVKARVWIATCSLALSALSGCTLDKKGDDADAFREAIPASESVALSGPESKRGSSPQASVGSPRTLGAGGKTPYAKWYGFTREMREGVNAVTAGVLGSVWVVVNTVPTSVAPDEATWGPYTDALSPAAYRLRVTRIAPDEYDYVLEGRPKASTDERDYLALLTGHGYGKPHASHGQGTFTIDLDATRTLDPFAHQNDSGTVLIEHDLPHDFSDNLGALPRTIVATVDPEGEPHFTVESRALQDGTGSIHVDAHADTDDSKATKLEDVVISSRWAPSGAGRADIDIAGGDLPESIPMVDAVECWGTDFVQSYYADSVGFQATVGEATACVYDRE